MMSGTLSPDAQAGSPGRRDRVVELKQRVGYDAALATERSDEQVVVDPQRFPVPAPLDGWRVAREVDPLDHGRVLLRLRCTQGDAIVTVKLLLHPAAERQRVAEHLIERANAVTTVAVTDTRGPAELGTLSLVPASGSVVYWIFRNVYAEVTVARSTVDKFEIARHVHAALVAAVRPL